jgi:NitT/TauT family transport system substrate-binding protein
LSALISRKRVLAAAGAALASAAVPGPVRAQAAPLRIGLLPIFDVAPYFAADQQGYFAAENVAVSLEIIRSGAAALPALLGGSLDLGYINGTSIVQALVRGIDLRIVLGGARGPATPPDPGALLKRKGTPYRTGKDLEGKIVGVNGLRDIQWMILTAWVKATGGDPTKLQIIELAIPAMVEAVKSGRADAALLLDPFMTIGLSDPAIELLAWPISEVYAGGPIGLFTLTPETAVARANDVRAFARAYRRGTAWVNANLGKDAYVNLVAGYSGINPELIRKMHVFPAASDIVPASLPRLTDLMTRTGLLSVNVDLRTKIFT